MTKQSTLTKEKITELYSDYILNQEKNPKNVFTFCKENHIEEKDFYHHFSDFEQIHQNIINHLFEKSLELASPIHENPDASTKEKLLNVYFIFFENLTMNRSLVLTILGKTSIQAIKNLQKLRKTHKIFVNSLNFKDWKIFDNEKENQQNWQEKSRQEALWLHLVSAIEFWKQDTSADFEKTDLFIEKTIDTGFELIYNEPLKKVFDLGKFLWKEKFKNH